MKQIFLFVWALALVLSPSIAAAAGPSTTGPTTSPITINSLTSDLVSGQPVATTVTWTASATDANGTALEYRFSVQQSGKTAAVARDFEASPSFTWTPILENTYTVQVSVQEVPPSTNGVVTLTSGNYSIVTRITGTTPVITPTSHPLVYLYSIPPCGKDTVNVQFGYGANTLHYMSTPTYPCAPLKSSNFYIAGLKANTQYNIRAIYHTGTGTTRGPMSTVTTGAIPSNFTFPTITEPVTVTSATDYSQPVIFQDTTGSGGPAQNVHMFATDILGNVIWYFNDTLSVGHQYVDRPLPGGSVFALLGDSLGSNQLLRAFDLVGNPIQETTTGRINEQLTALMTTPPAAGTSCGFGAAGQTICTVSQLHHEVNRMPNGHTVIFGYVEQLMPPGTQGVGVGGTTPVDILTDQIMDLDSNLQVDWTWNTFDHLNINQAAVLHETCVLNAGGCPTTLQYAAQAGNVAQDWTHSNAITYSAADHNILISQRHQDHILKINYNDTTGDGSVIWTLGNTGDFTLTNPPSGDTFPWFSHQHGIEINSVDTLVTFDDGNTRCSNGSGGYLTGCNSRGQVLSLNETAKTATLLANANMGNFSAALGWGQTLSNGDYFFTSGFMGVGTPTTSGQAEEFNSLGTVQTFVQQDSPALLYRAYRMVSMYAGCCGD